MKLEVLSIPSEHGEIFQYKLYDGPEGIDEFSGEFTSLGEVFEDVIVKRTITALDYQM